MLVFKLHLGQGEELLVAALLSSNTRLTGRPTLRALESNQLFALCTMQQLSVGLFPENEYCIMTAFQNAQYIITSNHVYSAKFIQVYT